MCTFLWREEGATACSHFSSVQSHALSAELNLTATSLFTSRRSRLVRRQAGDTRRYPRLRCGHFLLHGRLRSSNVNSSSKLGRRCPGNQRRPERALRGCGACPAAPPDVHLPPDRFSDLSKAAYCHGAAELGFPMPCSVILIFSLTRCRAHCSHTLQASPRGTPPGAVRSGEQAAGEGGRKRATWTVRSGSGPALEGWHRLLFGSRRMRNDAVAVGFSRGLLDRVNHQAL